MANSCFLSAIVTIDHKVVMVMKTTGPCWSHKQVTKVFEGQTITVANYLANNHVLYSKITLKEFNESSPEKYIRESKLCS